MFSSQYIKNAIRTPQRIIACLSSIGLHQTQTTHLILNRVGWIGFLLLIFLLHGIEVLHVRTKQVVRSDPCKNAHYRREYQHQTDLQEGRKRLMK